jgi:hypothetical protein
MQRPEEHTTTHAKPSFWRDLNVFVAAFVAMTSLGSFILVVPLSLLVKLVVPARQAELLAYPLGYALLALGLIYWWWKHGLSPRERNPARESRFRWGHVLLAVFNVALLAMFIPSLLGSFSMLPRMPAVAGFIVPLITLAPMGVIAGLFMVWSSRGKTPEFADTLPGAQSDLRNAQTGKLPSGSHLEKQPAGAVKPSIAPSAAAVVVGLVVSSLMLFVATVFASLGFQGNTSRFTGLVLPILFVIYVFWASVAISLLTKRRSSAIWVAWGPVGLFTVGLPVLQVVMMLLGPLFGR